MLPSPMEGLSAIAVVHEANCKLVNDLMQQLKVAQARKRTSCEALAKEEREKERKRIETITELANGTMKSKATKNQRAGTVPTVPS